MDYGILRKGEAQMGGIPTLPNRFLSFFDVSSFRNPKFPPQLPPFLGTRSSLKKPIKYQKNGAPFVPHLGTLTSPGRDVWSTGSQGSPSPFGIFRGLDGTWEHMMEGEKSTNPDDTKRFRLKNLRLENARNKQKFSWSIQDIQLPIFVGFRLL